MLPDNWDDEGSPPYKKVTYDKALEVYQNINASPDLSKFTSHIFHGFNGGIDLLWESPDFTMLVRLNADVNQAHFYIKTPQNEWDGDTDLEQFYIILRKSLALSVKV